MSKQSATQSPTQKRLYYRTVLKRGESIQSKVLFFFSLFNDPCRMMTEPFLRRNFGERHFTLTWAIFWGIVFATLPLFIFQRILGSQASIIISKQWSWYVFLAAYFIMIYIRKQEIKRLPSVFDFERYSLHTGDVLPFFKDVKIKGEKADIRTIEILLEPALVLAVGILAVVFYQVLLGGFLIFAAIICSLSKSLDYLEGDNYVMDIIDNMIVNRDMEKSFVLEEETPSGFRFMGKRPNTFEGRENMLGQMIDEDDASEVI